MTPTFKNRQNPCVMVEGKETYLSRSVAVAVALYIPDTSDFLLVKRGPDVEYTGMYCLPCGYLDYAETAEEAAARELYEETGYIVDPEDLTIYWVNSLPKSNRQNVVIMYTVEWDKVKNKNDNTYTPDKGEVTEVVWSSQLDKKEEFAFQHNEVIWNIIFDLLIVTREEKLKFDKLQKEMSDSYEKIALNSGLNDLGKDLLFDFLHNSKHKNFISYLEETSFKPEDLIP